ncbi:hypothetical protein [Paraliomyxa miuraensis]|uniref:hypothetical protein n=1 Tax=Paraliomyxa miuraensis TaxID=376150 RepID=UPI002259AFA0|nr:hypothetical protein [Paraliomyxa miuraensis]MCX4239042.1 hypothetical protein [Paraliomyxa miuraensis]
MEREDELRALGKELDALGPVGGRGHIKGDLKVRIVAAAKRAIGGDTKRADVAAVLGMSASTLGRWLHEDAAKREVRLLREMTVIGGEPDSGSHYSSAETRGRWPRVVLPNGVVLEGLDTEQIVTILRALA